MRIYYVLGIRDTSVNSDKATHTEFALIYVAGQVGFEHEVFETFMRQPSSNVKWTELRGKVWI